MCKRINTEAIRVFLETICLLGQLATTYRNENDYETIKKYDTTHLTQFCFPWISQITLATLNYPSGKEHVMVGLRMGRNMFQLTVVKMPQFCSQWFTRTSGDVITWLVVAVRGKGLEAETLQLYGASTTRPRISSCFVLFSRSQPHGLQKVTCQLFINRGFSSH